MWKQITDIMPVRIRTDFEKLPAPEEVTQIRLRTGCPVYLNRGGREELVGSEGRPCHSPSRALWIREGELREVLDYISRFSLYAFQEELRQGFLTLPGGHRVGLCGQAVSEQGEIRMMKQISSLNVRIAHSVHGSAEGLLPWLLEGDRLRNTLLFSPPGGGKTTCLRELVRRLSDGEGCRGRSVGLADSRSEVAACVQGVPGLSVGSRTDVMDRCPRGPGLELLLRTMAPEVLAADEIGSPSEGQAILACAGCGCSILATAHGSSLAELLERPLFRELEQNRVFERYVQLTGPQEGFRRLIWDRDGKLLSS